MAGRFWRTPTPLITSANSPQKINLFAARDFPTVQSPAFPAASGIARRVAYYHNVVAIYLFHALTEVRHELNDFGNFQALSEDMAYCWFLMIRHRTAKLLSTPPLGRSIGIVIAMGLLWGGSIFLYGASTPRLGNIGPSIGWPLSLAVSLLVANLMGLLLGEWRGAGAHAVRTMNLAIVTLLCAIVLCAVSTRITG
jgi:hypothetical protein